MTSEWLNSCLSSILALIELISCLFKKIIFWTNDISFSKKLAYPIRYSTLSIHELYWKMKYDIRDVQITIDFYSYIIQSLETISIEYHFYLTLRTLHFSYLFLLFTISTIFHSECKKYIVIISHSWLTCSDAMTYF